MTCEHCEPLRVQHPISTPADLRQAIRIVRANLEDGRLVEVEGGGPDVVPFGSLPPEAPWPDHFQCRFACSSCGTRFRLAAETYHGSGGSWAPEPPP